MTTERETGRPGVVLTAVGPDRPGLVNALAALLSQAGANIEDTRMAKLGGEFAVLMLVTGTDAVLEDLGRVRATAEGQLGITCTLKHTATPSSSPEGLYYHIEISGLDRPGIVESVSQVLAKQGINVVSLSSRVVHAPLTGTPMFLLEADLSVPVVLNLPQLRRELGEACERENLDFSLEPGRA